MINLDEDAAMQRVTEQLKTSYSQSRSADEIEAAISTAYASLSATPIRTYVPVLVERRARHLLRRHADGDGTRESARHGIPADQAQASCL